MLSYMEARHGSPLRATTTSSVLHITKMLLQILGGWRRTPNNRISSFKDALHQTGYEGIEATVGTREFLWAGALLRMGDQTAGNPRGSGQESWKTRNNVGRGGEEERIDKLSGRSSSGARVFGITAGRCTTALDPGAWHNTVCEGGCRFLWPRG